MRDVSTLGQLAAFAAMLGLLWSFWRGGGNTALSQLKTANEVLERRVEALEAERATLRERISELSAQTDFAAALEPLVMAVRDAIHELEQQHAQNEESQRGPVGR